MSEYKVLKPLFPLGQVVATPGALAALENAGQAPFEFLMRHACGDWGGAPSGGIDNCDVVAIR